MPGPGDRFRQGTLGSASGKLARAARQAAAAGHGATTESAAGRPLGNLVAGRDLIVSMRPSEISVYPQAHVVLEVLYTKLKDKPRDPEMILDVADLELTLGLLDRAEPRLENIRQHGSDAQLAARAEELLRDVYVRKIHNHAGRTGVDERTVATLDRLAALSGAPEHFGKYLLERSGSVNDRDNP